MPEETICRQKLASRAMSGVTFLSWPKHLAGGSVEYKLLSEATSDAANEPSTYHSRQMRPVTASGRRSAQKERTTRANQHVRASREPRENYRSVSLLWIVACRTEVRCGSYVARQSRVVHKTNPAVPACGTVFIGWLERSNPSARNYLIGADSSRPRYLSMALILGGAPRQASYILARSSVSPRDRII